MNTFAVILSYFVVKRALSLTPFRGVPKGCCGSGPRAEHSGEWQVVD